jgi:hypothetical protein
MAKPRLNQFADDLGITRSAAKKLMNKARGRKDGGSQTVEKHMGEMKKPKTRTGDPEYNELFKAKRAEHLRRKQEKEIEGRKDGGLNYMKCGGYGKAIQGTKFTGVK